MAIPELISRNSGSVSAIPDAVSSPNADLHPSRYQGQLYSGQRGRRSSGRSLWREHPRWGAHELWHHRWRHHALCEGCGAITAPSPPSGCRGVSPRPDSLRHTKPGMATLSMRLRLAWHWLYTNKPTFPQRVVQVGILYQKSLGHVYSNYRVICEH